MSMICTLCGGKYAVMDLVDHVNSEHFPETLYSCGHDKLSAKAYTIRSEPEKHYCSKACAMIYDSARYFEQVKQDRRAEVSREPKP